MRADFLLSCPMAKKIYEAVSCLPIVDYHNHLSHKEIGEDRAFTDLYDLWVAPDPYKHRAMRMCGVAEERITGAASKEEKFAAWWEILPRLTGNPLSHWSVMELFFLFGEEILPDGKDGKGVYEKLNQKLAEKKWSVSSLMEAFGVEKACPCASFADDLSAFSQKGIFSPSLRGDDGARPTRALAETLSRLTGIPVSDLASYKKALSLRLDQFQRVDCRFADHALDDGFFYYEEDGKNDERFLRLLKGEANEEDNDRLFSHLLTFLGAEYAKRGFVLQLHVGALRATSTRLRNLAGPAGGYAGIGKGFDIASLSRYLNGVEEAFALPKTMLFPLNPSDNAAISTLSGSFSADGKGGLVTQGPAWWWCDHKKGIEDMLENNAVFGLLSNFVGMTTDSRSFLSFVRHDYFRRLLASFLGDAWERGEIFSTEEDLLLLANEMCYENAKKCFE